MEEIRKSWRPASFDLFSFSSIFWRPAFITEEAISFFTRDRGVGATKVYFFLSKRIFTEKSINFVYLSLFLSSPNALTVTHLIGKIVSTSSKTHIFCFSLSRVSVAKEYDEMHAHTHTSSYAEIRNPLTSRVERKEKNYTSQWSSIFPPNIFVLLFLCLEEKYSGKKNNDPKSVINEARFGEDRSYAFFLLSGKYLLWSENYVCERRISNRRIKFCNLTRDLSFRI